MHEAQLEALPDQRPPRLVRVRAITLGRHPLPVLKGGEVVKVHLARSGAIYDNVVLRSRRTGKKLVFNTSRFYRFSFKVSPTHLARLIDG